MPNWCDNTLTVTGAKKELDKFKELSMKGGNFGLSGVLATPKELIETVSPDYCKEDDDESRIMHEKKVKNLIDKYGHSNWYDWRITNWGTKWDIADDMQCVLANEDNEVMVNFSSAWAPPISWMSYAANMFPSLKFRMSYMEEGMGFCGCITIENGIMLEEDGEIRYEDEDGNELKYDGNNWFYEDSKEIVDTDGDVWPTAINPFE